MSQAGPFLGVGGAAFSKEPRALKPDMTIDVKHG